jgi:Transmembrane secretion effector
MQMPPYRRLLIGQGTAFIGSMLTQVAVPVQVYAISHSSLYVGLVGLAGLLPIVIFGLYGGAIADAARGGDGRGPISWVGGGIACVVVVKVAALAVPSFWRYSTHATDR